MNEMAMSITKCKKMERVGASVATWQGMFARKWEMLPAVGAARHWAPHKGIGSHVFFP